MRFLISFFLIFILAGCAARRENIIISPLSIGSSPKVVITQVEGFESPCYHREGDQGAIDCLINAAITSGDEEQIKKTNAQSILETKYYQAFQVALQNKLGAVSTRYTTLARQHMKANEKDGAQHSPYDVSHLKAHTGADYALILEPVHFGIYRTYYGFIPTSAPQGWTWMHVYFVKLADNSLVGYNAVEIKVPVESDNLVLAVQKSLEQALEQARRFFFDCNPHMMALGR